MSRIDEECWNLKIWPPEPAYCHKCGWHGLEEELKHKFENGITLPDGTHVPDGNSKYAGAACPQCEEQVIFQCKECSWHGYTPVEGVEGFPCCPECGSSYIDCNVQEHMLRVIQQSVEKEAQLTLGITA